MSISSLSLLVALFGCSYDEGLVIEDMVGTVVVPREAATRTFVYDDGSSVEVTDSRLIGPVYLGLYASVLEGLEPYPHPERGPVFQSELPGDTYPYGGTTMGDFRFACMEYFQCRMVSGRYNDFDEIVDWFNETVKDPIVDQFGVEVTNGEYIRQTCYELMDVTTDAEVRITGDVDFVENSDGDFEAEFTIWQQDYYDGFTLWGWMDTPSETSLSYSTCNPASGWQEAEYNSNYFAGRQYRDLLNYPSIYVANGDYTTLGYVYSDVTDTPTLRLDIPVED